MSMVLQVGLLALGFWMLIKGADWFVEGTSGIARRFGIPQLIIGLTIVAMGTSAPEAAVSITAALKGNVGITIGNVVGSNILNILIILGLASVIVPLAVARSTVRVEIPFMIAITALLLGLGVDGTVSLADGIVLTAAFAVYLGYLFVMAKKNPEQEPEESKLSPLWKSLLGAAVGLVLIVWGSDVTVDAATKIAQFIGLSDRFIGLTIVALGTSLPELFTSVTAARRGNADIAIGNIVGSNIFNILFVIGTTSLICAVPFEPKFVTDTVIAILSGILLWIGTCRNRELRRGSGIIMLAGYVLYFIYLCTI